MDSNLNEDYEDLEIKSKYQNQSNTYIHHNISTDEIVVPVDKVES